MAEPARIDFSAIEGPVYTGRNRGERLRAEYQLDAFDKGAGTVTILIPDNTYSISSSFFLGMFGPSVINAGNKETFVKKYHFIASDFLRQIIDGHISRALQERTLFFK